MKLLIPVASGMEQITKRQLQKLGYDKAPADNGRLQLEGDWQDIAKLNVFLRSGERVLIQLSQFHATTFDELYEGFYSIPWEDWLTVESKILMDGKSVQSQLGAIKACGGVAKKAIISRLADKIRTGRKTFAETGARSIVGFSIFKDEVTVTLDTSGEGLHKRGYRSLAYSAPLKETLASALIDSTFYNPDKDMEKPFADPFCGSGTLPIEGARKALHIPPGLDRDFDFAKWACAPKGVLEESKAEGRGRNFKKRQAEYLGKRHQSRSHFHCQIPRQTCRGGQVYPLLGWKCGRLFKQGKVWHSSLQSPLWGTAFRGKGSASAHACVWENFPRFARLECLYFNLSS